MSTTPYFRVRNFEKFQHYKERRPPWIKLYGALLEDYAFGCLHDASKAHAILIWILASRHENRLPYDAAWIGRAIQATTIVDLGGLRSAGFIELCDHASDVLACCTQDAMPRVQSTENREQTEQPHSAGAESPPREPAPPKRPARSAPSRAPKAAPSSPDVEAVVAAYVARHPRRLVSDKARRLIARVLALPGWDVAGCVAAVNGNADDAWHAEKRKHELEYVLRDDKRDGFREMGEAAHAAPACALPNADRGWLDDTLDRLTDPRRAA